MKETVMMWVSVALIGVLVILSCVSVFGNKSEKQKKAEEHEIRQLLIEKLKRELNESKNIK